MAKFGDILTTSDISTSSVPYGVHYLGTGSVANGVAAGWTEVFFATTPISYPLPSPNTDLALPTVGIWDVSFSIEGGTWNFFLELWSGGSKVQQWELRFTGKSNFLDAFVQVTQSISSRTASDFVRVTAGSTGLNGNRVIRIWQVL